MSPQPSRLLLLPTETLTAILHLVGAAEFRARLDRLLVCKAWYQIAHAVLLEDVKLSANGLEKLSLRINRLQPLLSSRVNSLSIHLVGFEDWESLHGVVHDNRRSQGARGQLDSWTHRTNWLLMILTASLPFWTKLSE